MIGFLVALVGCIIGGLIYWSMNKTYQCKMLNVSHSVLYLDAKYIPARNEELQEGVKAQLITELLALQGLKPTSTNIQYLHNELIRLDRNKAWVDNRILELCKSIRN